MMMLEEGMLARVNQDVPGLGRPWHSYTIAKGDIIRVIGISVLDRPPRVADKVLVAVLSDEARVYTLPVLVIEPLHPLLQLAYEA